MDRRSFLKGLLVAPVAVVAAPFIARAVTPDEDPVDDMWDFWDGSDIDVRSQAFDFSPVLLASLQSEQMNLVRLNGVPDGAPAHLWTVETA